MRGPDIQQDSLFSTVIPEQRVPQDHPLWPIREMVNGALRAMDGDFSALYAPSGRDSIPPEKLLRTQLLMAGTHAGGQGKRTKITPTELRDINGRSNLARIHAKKGVAISRNPLISLVARDRIELPTRGFSGPVKSITY